MAEPIRSLGRSVGGMLGLNQPLPEEEEAPVPDDLEVRRAMERATARKYKGKGRAGTVLTNNTNKLG